MRFADREMRVHSAPYFQAFSDMPRKKHPPLHCVSDDAVAIRSGACACCTVLVDDSYLPTLNGLSFDPIAVARRGTPKKNHDRLRRLAGRGQWMAITSRPDIVDSDGVPYLDLVVAKRGDDSPIKSFVSDNGTQDVFWYDPVEQLLDLPSGRLRLVYCDEFFNADFDQEEEGGTDEPLRSGIDNAIYAGAPSILIQCEPGFYRATAFTRFDEKMSDLEPPEGSADLVIVLEHTEKPKSFKTSVPLLPIHPSNQDVKAYRRKVLGEDTNQGDIASDQARVNENGEIQSFISESALGIVMALPVSVAEEFGFECGMLLSMETCGVNVQGVSCGELNPSSKVRKQIDKEKKKPGTFVSFMMPSETMRKSTGDFLFVYVLKQGRNDSIKLPAGKTCPAILRKQTDRAGNPRRILL